VITKRFWEMQMMDDEKSKFDEDIRTFAEQIKALNNQAYMYYKPITEELCRGRASESEVEHELDRMLQFCGSDEMLNLFKRICRCYYERYPEMIAFEINGYREMWDE
jgi:hypothetical protein